MSKPLGAIRPSSVSNGLRHHMTTSARERAAGDASPTASSAVFESSQRRRVTPCVHAKR